MQNVADRRLVRAVRASYVAFMHEPVSLDQFDLKLLAGEAPVREAHSLAGSMDCLIKVCLCDLKSLSAFINDVLLLDASVSHVQSSIVLDTLKDSAGLPIER